MSLFLGNRTVLHGSSTARQHCCVQYDRLLQQQLSFLWKYTLMQMRN